MSSDNKYGLDFRVWGHEKTEKKKNTTPDILKSIEHGWGESSKPKKQQEQTDFTTERIEPKKEQITCVLKNARFLPDENTDFKKPCKIRVEIEGKSNRIVHFYLWAIYEGVEYDLQYEVKAGKKNDICETEMKLFYVDQFYIDFYNNGKKDAKVEYFAKIKMQGAKEIRSEILVMPRELPTLNIKDLHEAPMQTSEYGKQFIMKHEGFMAKPYNCSAGHATIGYGTLLHKGPVNEDDIIKYGTGITKETAKAMFDKSIVKFENALNKAVKVTLNQNQFDALMSWTYNFGEAQLNEKYTKWLRELNKGDYNIVPSEILRWNKITKNGIKIESAGLTKRRKEESELFKENIW
jgi:GH24 family phage-related lysozyme (muramidase)